MVRTRVSLRRIAPPPNIIRVRKICPYFWLTQYMTREPDTEYKQSKQDSLYNLWYNSL